MNPNAVTSRNPLSPLGAPLAPHVSLAGSPEGDAGFARMLEQQRSERPAPREQAQAAPAHADRENAPPAAHEPSHESDAPHDGGTRPAQHEAASSATPSQQDGKVAARNGARNAAKPRATEKARAESGESAAPADRSESKGEDIPVADASTASQAGAAPEDKGVVLDWLARMNTAAARAGGDAGGTTPRAAVGGDASTAAPSSDAKTRGIDLHREALPGAPVEHAASDALAFEAQLAQAAGQASPAGPKTGEGSAALQGATALHATAHANPADAAAPAQALIDAPLDAPDFSQALAAQLTTFARDGVHEAKLELNPADMGPIAVQIVVDGTQAQIDFHASHAATRGAIEASLPALAASLQSAGLTLSGGGVYEQAQRDARQGSGDADARGSTGRTRGGDASGEPAVRSVTARTAQGVLDLYA